MAQFHIDVIRCRVCGSTTWEEKTAVTLPKTIVERDNKELPLPNLSKEYQYACMGCGELLEK
jgi:hypothetical protein